MNEQPKKKKKHSLWWIWILLILAAYAGGIVTGLKLNTLPLPNQVQAKLYPILESYIPGSTKTHETETPAPAETEAPAETAAPVETQAPAETAVPTETAAPAETEAPTPSPEPTAEPAPPETPAPLVEDRAVPALTEAGAPAEDNPSAKYIGVNRALEIAMQDADPGEKKAEVSGVYRTKDDDGNPVYEVSFTVDEIVYDYVIDAVSGEIMSWRLSGLSFSDIAAFGGAEGAEPEAAPQ